jgi:hypothetical protein
MPSPLDALPPPTSAASGANPLDALPPPTAPSKPGFFQTLADDISSLPHFAKILSTAINPAASNADRAAAWTELSAPSLQNMGEAMGYAKSGQPVAAGIRAAESVPIAGPMARAISHSIDTGDYGAAAARGLEVALPHIIEPVAGVLGKPAAAVSEAARAPFKVDPEAGINTALKFKPTADIRNLRQAVADVKAAETVPITGNESLLNTIPAAKAANRTAFEAYIKNAGNSTVSGSPVVAATAASIPDTMWIESPELAQKVLDSVKGYARDFTAPELANVLEQKNGELASFYNRAPGAQAAAVQSGAPEAVVKAQRDAVARILYDFIDPENKGAGPAAIQRRYGAIQELEEAAQARANAIAREKAVSTAASGVKLAQAAGKLIKLDPEAAVRTWQGSDSLIRRAFANIDPDGVHPTPAAVSVDPSPVNETHE